MDCEGRSSAFRRCVRVVQWLPVFVFGKAQYRSDVFCRSFFTKYNISSLEQLSSREERPWISVRRRDWKKYYNVNLLSTYVSLRQRAKNVHDGMQDE